MFKKESLPDVTTQSYAQTPLALQWVGMEKIAVPLFLRSQGEPIQRYSAKADVYTQLNKADAKGIHMSRLYLHLNQFAEQECDRESIEGLLDRIIESQEGISNASKVRLTFECLLQKQSLLSGKSGYQSYDVSITAEKSHGVFTCSIEIVIPYSSTCPCSASLSRQLYSQAIDEKFPANTVDKEALLAWVQSDEGSVATPHSQRSYAYINLTLAQSYWPDISALVMQLESFIATPVQTAVKRSDEQEFARLNAKNLVFCEDAARQIKQGLEKMDFVVDYWLKVEHQESLHAHNAVVVDRKDSVTTVL